MSSITDLLTARIERALFSLKQAPLEASLGLFMAIVGCAIASASRYHGSMDLWARAMLMMYPLLVTLFATTILHRFEIISSAARIGLSVSYLVLAGLYVHFRLDPDIYHTELWRLLTLYLGATAGLALIPLVIVRRPARASRDFFWQFNAQLLAHVLLSVSFLGALTIGINVGLLAIDELLGIHVRGASYARVAIFVLIGLVPWQITTILPQLHQEPLQMASAVRQLGKVLCTYLFLPLMSVYLIILYIYQIQVIASGFQEAPRNMMSPLVLAAAAMLLVGMLLADQLRAPDAAKEGEAPGVFLKVSPWLPVLFLPLMPMSAWAVGIRIEQYGLTEFRYLRMLLIVALSVIFVLGTVQYFRKKPQPLTSIIATFGALAVMASIGPLSAPAVSQRSQRARLIEALEARDLWDKETGRIITVSKKEQEREMPDRAFECISYLTRNFGVEAFEELLSPAQYAELRGESKQYRKVNAWHVMHVLHMRRDFSTTEGGAENAIETPVAHFESRAQGFAPHAGHLSAVNFYKRNQTHSVQLVRGGQVRITLDESGQALSLTALSQEGHLLTSTTRDLRPLIHYLVEHREGALTTNLSAQLPREHRDHALETYEGLPQFTVTIKQISLQGDGEGAWSISSLQTVAVEGDGPVARD